VSLRDVAEQIVETTGFGEVATVPWPEGYEEVETGDFLCDIRRAEEVLGWRPVLDLGTGLKRTIETYRQILAGLTRSGGAP